MMQRRVNLPKKKNAIMSFDDSTPFVPSDVKEYGISVLTDGVMQNDTLSLETLRNI